MEATDLPASKEWTTIARWLIIGTLGYNIVEAVVALWSGWAAHSNALVGFGLDSVIESAAAGVMLWRLSVEARGASPDAIERAEARVRKFVGATFFGLVAYVGVKSVLTLIRQEAPSESWVGIGLAIASLIIMPVIALYKMKAADRIGSRALRSEARETLACSYLSLTLLLGLSLHAFSESLWWADPGAALLMVPWLIREGFEGFETES